MTQADADTPTTRVRQHVVTAMIGGRPRHRVLGIAIQHGQTALRTSKSISVLNQGQYLEYADRMLLWNKAKVNGVSTELPGLTKRRQAERALFLTPGA